MTINRSIDRARMAWVVRMLRKESIPFSYLHMSTGSIDVSYKVGNGRRSYRAPAKGGQS